MLAAVVQVVFACGETGSLDGRDAGSSPKRQSDFYLLDTMTTCSAGGLSGADRGESLVEFDRDIVTIGFDDEVLAGIPLRVGFDGVSFGLGDVAIPTPEQFGEVRLRGAVGAFANGYLSLEYEFEVLDVSCTTIGRGSRLK